MAQKLFRVGELGVGSGRKIVELARGVRHLNVEFLGVDLEPVGRYADAEKRFSAKNLRVERGKDAEQFLREQPPESFDHLYAHFLLQHVPYSRRQSLYGQIMRSLKPSAHFATVENIHFLRQLSNELESKGFEVHSRQLSSEELLQLGSDNAQHNAEHALALLGMLADLPENPTPAARATGIPSRGEAIRTDLKVTRKKIGARLEKLEGSKKSREARVAIDRVLKDVEKFYSQQPFAIIFARKLARAKPA